MMEYYSVIKRKNILLYATTWMNLKDILPSAISQSQKNRQVFMILLLGVICNQTH